MAVSSSAACSLCPDSGVRPAHRTEYCGFVIVIVGPVVGRDLPLTQVLGVLLETGLPFSTFQEVEPGPGTLLLERLSLLARRGDRLGEHQYLNPLWQLVDSHADPSRSLFLVADVDSLVRGPSAEPCQVLLLAVSPGRSFRRVKDLPVNGDWMA